MLSALIFKDRTGFLKTLSKSDRSHFTIEIAKRNITGINGNEVSTEEDWTVESPPTINKPTAMKARKNAQTSRFDRLGS